MQFGGERGALSSVGGCPPGGDHAVTCCHAGFGQWWRRWICRRWRGSAGVGGRDGLDRQSRRQRSERQRRWRRRRRRGRWRRRDRQQGYFRAWGRQWRHRRPQWQRYGHVKPLEYGSLERHQWQWRIEWRRPHLKYGRRRRRFGRLWCCRHRRRHELQRQYHHRRFGWQRRGKSGLCKWRWFWRRWRCGVATHEHGCGRTVHQLWHHHRRQCWLRRRRRRHDRQLWRRRRQWRPGHQFRRLGRAGQQWTDLGWNRCQWRSGSRSLRRQHTGGPGRWWRGGRRCEPHHLQQWNDRRWPTVPPIR